MIAVAVGVVFNEHGEVLIARRHAHQHQGNLWEFPGGKIEPQETLAEALRREFLEELGVQVLAPDDLSPWLSIDHDYGDRQVSLQVARIDISGTPMGLEGQQVCWRAQQALNPNDFPVANAPIIAALQKG
jgi:8-oxo-dGTP diphosphatase